MSYTLGYAYRSVPFALYAWLRHHDDFRQALKAALDCGGDTDTVGAIVGAIVGAKVGNEGLPPEFIAGICEWPRSVSLLEQIAARLAEQKDSAQALGPVRYFWPGGEAKKVSSFLGITAGRPTSTRLGEISS